MTNKPKYTLELTQDETLKFISKLLELRKGNYERSKMTNNEAYQKWREEMELSIKELVYARLNGFVQDGQKVKDTDFLEKDLGFDSLDFDDLLADMDEHFNALIPNDKIDGDITVKAFIQIIEDAVSKLDKQNKLKAELRGDIELAIDIRSNIHPHNMILFEKDETIRNYIDKILDLACDVVAVINNMEKI